MQVDRPTQAEFALHDAIKSQQVIYNAKQQAASACVCYFKNQTNSSDANLGLVKVTPTNFHEKCEISPTDMKLPDDEAITVRYTLHA